MTNIIFCSISIVNDYAGRISRCHNYENLEGESVMPYNIYCAAHNTKEELKKKANFICDGTDARPTLQKAIEEAERLGVSCVLFPGIYEINSSSEKSPRGAIRFYNPTPAERLYKSYMRYSVLKGVKPPFGFRDGAIITLGKKFYESLPDGEEFSVFYTEGNNIFTHGMIIQNLGVQLPANKKPVVVFNGSFSAGLRYEDCFACAVDLDSYDPATGEGVPVPNPRSVAFRGCHGSNNYTTEWKNLAAIGFGVGFDIGGEHVYCESLSAYHGIYGFAFDCYKGRTSIDSKADAPALGVSIYPIVCVNLLDEHNVHMPRFGNASHNGKTPNKWKKSITILGMNLQWPNTCPGHTDRTAPDFLANRSRAKEDQIGSWGGTIEYVLDHSTEGHGVNICDEPFFENGHGVGILVRNHHQNNLTHENA